MMIRTVHQCCNTSAGDDRNNNSSKELYTEKYTLYILYVVKI